MSITATVENDTIKLPAGVHVPDGTKVEITLPAEGAEANDTGDALACEAPLRLFASRNGA